MHTVNVHEAKTHLSRLLARVVAGESVTISRAGKPVAKLVPLDKAEKKPKRRIGFLAGRISVSDDFDRMAEKEIEEMFYGSPDK